MLPLVIFTLLITLITLCVFAIDILAEVCPIDNYEEAAANNYKVANRTKKEITHTVIHAMSGSYLGTIEWFKNPSTRVSVHYVISKEGHITQMVRG